jgi:hypothetical protein
MSVHSYIRNRGVFLTSSLVLLQCKVTGQGLALAHSEPLPWSDTQCYYDDAASNVTKPAVVGTLKKPEEALLLSKYNLGFNENIVLQ